MKRILGTILFVIYSIVAIGVTVLLLSFNDYNCSEIGGYTVFIVKDDLLEPRYKEGSILIIKHSSDRNIQVGEELLLYKVINTQEFEVVTRTLEAKKQQASHIVYEVSEAESYAEEYVIGKTENTTVIEGWGILLSILESKWGYLFCIVIVSLLLFLQEVFDLVIEIKYGGGKSAKGTKTTTKTTSAKTATPKKTTTAKSETTTKTSTAKTTTGTKSTAKKSTTTAKTTAKTTAAPKKVAKEESAKTEEVEEG